MHKNVEKFEHRNKSWNMSEWDRGNDNLKLLFFSSENLFFCLIVIVGWMSLQFSVCHFRKEHAIPRELESSSSASDLTSIRNFDFKFLIIKSALRLVIWWRHKKWSFLISQNVFEAFSCFVAFLAWSDAIKSSSIALRSDLNSLREFRKMEKYFDESRQKQWR